ncbi:hypothetical protein MPSEU_000410900 [Mayamaea pseudoterrestris]|nr:hypothetical protein MPSEU_000410900 [Mayamaea pseudoterrestris]
MPTFGDLTVIPSTLEVDYDKNLTELYQAITDQKWDRAAQIAKKYPVQAATWVVRHYEDDDEIMWRFLPIHSACARQPPAYVIQALLKAYPDGAKCVDDQGMYPLHYACGNQASRDVIRMLLVNFPEAAKLPDPRGMLPIHYLACWGPSSVSVVDMLLVAHRDVASCRDEEGNTPLDLAREGDYPERAAVMTALKKWMDDAGSKKSSGGGSSKKSSRGLSVHAYDQEEKKEDNEDTVKRAVSPTQVNRLEEQVRQLQHKLVDNSKQRSLSKGRGAEDEISTDGSKGISRIQRDIRKLQGELAHKEANELEEEADRINSKMDSAAEARQEEHYWRRKFQDLDKKYTEREKELLMENGELTDMHHKAKEELKLVQSRLDGHDNAAKQKDEKIKDLESKLESSKLERDGLRSTLGDLMEQHDNFKKKAHNLSDRLGSLSVSLESMMDQQKALAKAMQERNEQYQNVLRQRQTKLKELEELERGMEKDENMLESSLEKQMKEMEAIAAVIAAARE